MILTGYSLLAWRGCADQEDLGLPALHLGDVPVHHLQLHLGLQLHPVGHCQVEGAGVVATALKAYFIAIWKFHGYWP